MNYIHVIGKDNDMVFMGNLLITLRLTFVQSLIYGGVKSDLESHPEYIRRDRYNTVGFSTSRMYSIFIEGSLRNFRPAIRSS